MHRCLGRDAWRPRHPTRKYTTAARVFKGFQTGNRCYAPSDSALAARADCTPKLLKPLEIHLDGKRSSDPCGKGGLSKRVRCSALIVSTLGAEPT